MALGFQFRQSSFKVHFLSPPCALLSASSGPYPAVVLSASPVKPSLLQHLPLSLPLHRFHSSWGQVVLIFFNLKIKIVYIYHM